MRGHGDRKLHGTKEGPLRWCALWVPLATWAEVAPQGREALCVPWDPSKYPPPPISLAQAITSFEGKSIDTGGGGGHVSSFETGGSIDTRMGGAWTRILVERLEKSFVQAFSNLCHQCDICFVPLASL